jgi:hypothetical protein
LGGEIVSLKDIARPLIERGIRVVPAKPGERYSTLGNWQTLATTDPAAIDQWDKQYPDWNLVCVSNLEDVCIVDADDLDAATKLGMPEIPATFTVKSPRPTGHHAYFLHTEESRKLGTRTARLNGKAVAELKTHRQSCCAPGCVRADGGRYRVEDPAPLIPIPQEYVDWFRAVDPKEKPKDLKIVHDDFDFDKFCEFYDLEPMGGGPWYYLRSCPVKGDYHTNEGKPDFGACALYFDDEILGFKDLAQSCEGASMSIGGLIKFLNKQKGQHYNGPIWEEEETDPEKFGLADVEDEQPVVPVVEPAPLTSVFTNAIEVETPVPPKEAPPLESFLKYPELRFPYECLAPGRFKDLVDNASEGGLDPGLTCPAIMALASALPARTVMDGDRIGMFVCLLALVGAGKDLAMKRAIAVLGLEQEEGHCILHYTPNGERAVALRMGDKPGTKTDPGRKPGPARICMVTPEMEETLKKSKAETSGVLQAMQYFYDYNDKTIPDDRHAGDNVTINCRLSWLTALPVGKFELDRQSFREHFGENTSHGIASRMLFGFSERRVDPRHQRKWVAKPATSSSTVTTEVEGIGPITREDTWSLKSDLLGANIEGFESTELEKEYEEWTCPDLSGRDFQHVHKVSIMSALLNSHRKITRSDWDFATAFIGWQNRLRLMFATGRAKRVTQGEFNEMVFEETLRRTRKRLDPSGKDSPTVKIHQADGKKPIVFVRWKGMANDGDWHLYGMDIEKSIDAMVRGGTFEYGFDFVPSKNGDGKDDKIVEDKKWIRIVGVHRLLANNR